MLLGFNKILPTNSYSKLVQLFNLAVSGIVCGATYLIINYKHIKQLLPSKIVNKIENFKK